MFGILSVLVKQWRVTCVLYLPLYLNPLVSAMVSAISINASVCPWTNFTVSSIDVIHVVSWLLCLKANMKRNSKNIAFDPWLFLDGPPQNAQRKPVGKILDKQSCFKRRRPSRPLCILFLTLNHLSSAKWKHMSKPLRFVYLKDTLSSSLLSLRISFWAWADVQAKITHALPDVRDLRTSGNGCYQSPSFLRPRDQKKRRLWGREWHFSSFHKTLAHALLVTVSL